MAEFVYLDETGSTGSGGSSQQVFTLVAVVIPETHIMLLAEQMRVIARSIFDEVPENFEFHAARLWNSKDYWSTLSIKERIEVYERVIQLLDELPIFIAHSSIHKKRLHDRYSGGSDNQIYLLALQFLLEKLESTSRNGDLKRIIVADENDKHHLHAIKMVADMQTSTEGVISSPRPLNSVIDTMHFVNSQNSFGVQMADMVAFIIHRSRLTSQGHPDLDAAVARMNTIIGNHTSTWRDIWPSA